MCLIPLRNPPVRRSWPALLVLWIAGPPFALGEGGLSDLPAPDRVRAQLYATGFEIAEGPALDRQGNLYVVNYRGNGNIGRIAPDGTAGVFCDLRKLAPLEERTPQANGMKIDSQGRLVVADAGGARLLRVAADGKSVEVLADRCNGKRFQMLNDVALDRKGNIYFTDPGAPDAESPPGAIYRYDVATAKIAQLAAELAYPNGLAVTPDQRHLCVSESAAGRVRIYEIRADGSLGTSRVLITLPTEDRGSVRGGDFEPDGMIFDRAGRLYVAMWRGGLINVVEVPSGKLLRQYDAGGMNCTNCHFHDGWLYVTVADKEAVFRLNLGVEGFDYHPASGS